MDTHTINPLNIFWQSTAVRSHLTNAGRELACAMLTGFVELREAAVAKDLPSQYPYLVSAFQTVQSALGKWMGGDVCESDDMHCHDECPCDDAPAPTRTGKTKTKAKTKTARAPKTTTRKTTRRTRG